MRPLVANRFSNVVLLRWKVSQLYDLADAGKETHCSDEIGVSIDDEETLRQII